MKPILFEKTSLADAKRALDGTSRPTARLDWSSRRLSIDQVEPLHEATLAWLGALPESVRPAQLAERFPRIANKICMMWEHHPRCSDYLSDLLIVRRGSRLGFPAPIAKEISKLAVHRATLDPIGRPWAPTR